MPRFLFALIVLCLGPLLWAPLPTHAQDADDADEALPTIAEKTEGTDKKEGYFPLYWDTRQGKVWLEIPRFDEAFLYVSSLPAGLGSNDIGLDRGQLGSQRVVQFERVGNKVLLVEPNLTYRADTDNPAEREAVREAFASGVVWGFTVAAEEGERVLVDATDFVVRDAHGVVRRLKSTDQGSYTLDAKRSAPYPANLKAFPQNTEMEARLTFTTDGDPGRYVQDVAADPYALTMRVRHSLIQLPDTTGYTPRRFDPRSGFFPTTFYDYAVAIGTPITQRYINRHRLVKQNPDAEMSDPVEPIVYYLDPGTPEPVRSALLDGARWWAEAFEAAGFTNAYRVEMLPEGADPMDVRYNTIQWVHRATRGWSYGMSVTDPRTGEIIKGHVTLGSLRVRQDYLLAEGLLAPYTGDNGGGFPAEDDPMLEMALARIRQLSAHEVGHTLGLAHNFAASTNERASVMDYPAPLATLDENGQVVLSNAYDTGIGEWDKVAIRYGYATPAGGQTEDELLGQIIEEYQEEGLQYITDQDARPSGAAHPASNLWDNGTDGVSSLEREMAVRTAALSRFGEAAIQRGMPMAQMEEVLVPLYLRHRYQVDATAKMLGGVAYMYAMRGDANASAPTRVPAAEQEAALEALLATITPGELALPETVRNDLPPRPPGYPDNRELFSGHTGRTFDPYAPAEVASMMVLEQLTVPSRGARLVYQHDADASLPSLTAVLDRITEQVWETNVSSDPYDAELQRVVQQVWTDVLLERAATAEVAPAVRVRLTAHLDALQGWLEDNTGGDPETQAHRQYAAAQIERFLDRSREADVPEMDLELPPGSPIGQPALHTQPPTYLKRQMQRRAALAHWTHPTHACGYDARP